MSPPTTDLDDTAALAKGGRTSFFGFVLRLVGRVPFLFFSGRLYGPEELGRFAYAVLVVEFAAQLTTLGLKRGLAYELSSVPHDRQTNTVWDAMLATMAASLAAALLLAAFPHAMFPNSELKGAEWLLPAIALAVAGSDVALAALAYRHNVQASVLARSIVEQWTLSLAGILLYFTAFRRDGLIIAYVLAMTSAFAFSIWPLVRTFGWPREWRPDPRALWRMARRNMPLAGADAVEWTSRRIDIALLGLFFAPAWVGIYFVAQQVSTLAQRLKTSFDPILGPVISQKLQEGDKRAVARQVRQVGFWIIAAQGAVALALAIPGEAVMALSGDLFVAGTAALIFLLAAEVAASTAVVSEAALIYVARHRNLVISLSTLAVQAGLTVGLILGFRAVSMPAWLAGPLGVAPGKLPEAWAMTAPAIALLVSLGLASLVKSALLKRLLGQPVVGWRWPLVWAAVAATVAGKIVTWLPEEAKFAELPLGVPLILVVFGTILWRWGFTAEDRVLFRRTPKVKDPMAVSMPLD